MKPDTVSLIVAFTALLISLYRLNAASLNNMIAGSTPWAQLLMKYVEEEIKLAIREEALLKSAFSKGFETTEDKKKAIAELNETRSASSKNLFLLKTLAPSAKALLESRAALTGVYESFVDKHNTQLTTSPEAEQAFFARYDPIYFNYLETIREFSASVNIERPRLFKSLRAKNKKTSTNSTA